jgi:hypothetical protein
MPSLVAKISINNWCDVAKPIEAFGVAEERSSFTFGHLVSLGNTFFNTIVRNFKKLHSH